MTMEKNFLIGSQPSLDLYMSHKGKHGMDIQA